eukprot:scaffold944_cov333-Pavlova_lutheri.AAC.13
MVEGCVWTQSETLLHRCQVYAKSITNRERHVSRFVSILVAFVGEFVSNAYPNRRLERPRHPLPFSLLRPPITNSGGFPSTFYRTFLALTAATTTWWICLLSASCTLSKRPPYPLFGVVHVSTCIVPLGYDFTFRPFVWSDGKSTLPFGNHVGRGSSSSRDREDGCSSETKIDPMARVPTLHPEDALSCEFAFPLAWRSHVSHRLDASAWAMLVPPSPPSQRSPSVGLVVGREEGGRFPRLWWTHRDPPFGVGGVQSRSRNAPICPFDRDRSRRKARARSTSNERALGSVGRGAAWTWWQTIGWRT